MKSKLAHYEAKRRFDQTPEPSGRAGRSRAAGPLMFVVQRHDARRLHYDFRLELDGTLKSWAVPKGPSLDPAVKRLAVHVEDHPVEYGSFEGTIPEGSYGAGTVDIWDHGTWTPQGSLRDAREGYANGKLKFTLDGDKLHGGWMLVRSHMDDTKQDQWLLIKERDADARDQQAFDVVADEGPATKRAKAKKTARAPRKHAAEASLDGAVKASLPATLAPELATPATHPPHGDDWLYELKFDGYRVMARVERHTARILTRAGHDWSAKFGRQVEALARLDVKSAWLDGEAVVLDAHGIPDFQALQNAFDAGRADDIVLYLFDLPYLNGEDLREVPLEQRRARLEALLRDADRPELRFSTAFAGDATALLEAACEAGLEGLVAKRRDSAYRSTRSAAWLKLRCTQRQEFVIGGYTSPAGSRPGFGALLLGVYDDEGLQYAGRVGTGFDTAQLGAIARQLKARERSTAPFAHTPRADSRAKVHWVRPELVAECHFKSWTSDGLVRQASFIGLREDKPAREIVREASAPARTKTAAKHKETPMEARTSSRAAKHKDEADVVAGVRITHPERVIDPASGARKIDLARYFEWVAPWLLPHLAKRPVALARAPDGIGGELFFQKHATRLQIPHVTQHAGLDPGHEPLITIDNVKALAGAAQMGTIELHTWNALTTSIEKPDRIVFDLDPDSKLGWDRMIEAAQLTRDLLGELGLDAWCKTSGGKGLHVVVPLTRHAGWDETKQFAQAIAAHMADTLPERFSATMGERNRKGKIFVDYLRNNRGASTIAAYAPRAREGLGVSVPLTWDEVEHTTGGAQWTVANLHERLDTLRTDPWEGYAQAKQRITVTLLKRLGLK